MKFKPLQDRVVVPRIEGEGNAESAVIVVDKRYFREQASEALKRFVAPLSGIYAAAFDPVSLPADKETSQKTEGGV